MDMTLSPWMLDAVSVGIILEFLLLAYLLQRLGAARWILPLFWFLLSGLLLMQSVRAALADSPLEILASLLVASLFTHLAFLRSGWARIRK